MNKYLMSLMLLPSFAFAGANVGFTHIDLDGIKLNAANVSYTFDSDSDFQFEVGGMLGIGDDSVSESGVNVDVELDPSFFVRGIYNVSEQFFVNVNWTKIEVNLTASAGNVMVSEDASDSEVGFGFGFNLSENWTFLYDSIEDADVLTIRYNF